MEGYGQNPLTEGMLLSFLSSTFNEMRHLLWSLLSHGRHIQLETLSGPQSLCIYPQESIPHLRGAD